MKNVLFLIAFILFSPLQTYAGTYYNARFNFKVDYPDSFIPAGESDNGDGQRFINSAANAVIIVYGSYNIDIGGGDYTCSFKRYLNDHKNLNVTYKRELKDGFVISGLSGKDIEYNKVVMTKENSSGSPVCLSLIIKYPTDQKVAFDKIVKNVVDSFHPTN